MKNQQAKRLLEVFRPGGADAAEPRFAEALSRARRDPSLGRWLAEQQQFDRQFTAGLKTIEPPADLKQSILASRKVVRTRPSFWQGMRVRAAAAVAGLVLVSVVGGVWATARPTSFPKFRAELIEQAWDGSAHLDFEAADLRQIRQWLASHKTGSDFVIPEALREARVVGCRLVEADGHRVPMLCLMDGPKHMHLFVLDGMEFARLPAQDTPDFEKCGVWKTASWQHGNKTYVLTGLKYQTFVNKFRKSGRWALSG